jgi:hypothetical protein
MTTAPKKKAICLPAGPAGAAAASNALAKPSSRGDRPLAPIPTPGLDQAQLTKAAAALAKHARAAAGEGLFADDDELVYLVRRWWRWGWRRRVGRLGLGAAAAAVF